MAQVLIVYSSAEDTELPGVACDEAGHQVDFAPEGEAAGRLRRTNFDLVVITVSAPVTVARAMREVAPRAPMVAIVEPLPDGELSALRQAGVRGIVFKPAHIQTVRKVIADEMQAAPGRGAALRLPQSADGG